MPELPLLHLCKTAPGHNIDSIQCSTDPTLRLHVEQESLQCSTEMRLGRSGHVTADWRPLCKKTVIEASIWYRSDEAFATAFFQHWGTALVCTVKTTTVTHDRSKHFILWHCCTLSTATRRKQQGFYWRYKRQIRLQHRNIMLCAKLQNPAHPIIDFYIF